MTHLDPALRDHAARLLIGTDLPAAPVQEIAASRAPATGPVAAALRDGWDAADPATPDQRQDGQDVQPERMSPVGNAALSEPS